MMKRTKKSVSEDKDAKVLSWKKNGGGTFYLNKNRIIKPNEVFQATEDEIPLAFRDNIVSVDSPGVIPKKATKPKPVVNVEFTKKERENSKGWWDVFDQNDKKVNENALREDEADSLIAKLME